MIYVDEQLQEKVYSILTEVLGENATGIYCYDAKVDEEEESSGIFSVRHKGQLLSPLNENEDYKICHGASRVVIIPKNEEFVIKMPIMATYCLKYKLNKQTLDGTELEEVIYLDNPYESDIVYPQCREEEIAVLLDDGFTITSCDIICTREHNYECDLMERENEYRESGCAASQDLFLPNTFIGNFRGRIPVYLQPKVDRTMEEIYEYSDLTFSSEIESDFTKVSDLYTSYLPFGDDFIKLCINFFGVRNTIDILTDIDYLGIYDLHSGNLGLLENGEPCIFDYAGYPETEFWIYKGGY